MKPSRLVALAAALVALSLAPAASAADPGWLPWQGLASPQSEAWVRVIASSALPAPTIYAGTEGDGVFRSTNDGITWSPFSTGLAGAALAIRAIHPSGSDVLVGTTIGLFRSSGGGAFQPVAQGAGPGKLNQAVQAILSSSVPGQLLVGTVSNGVWRSSDGGATWQPPAVGNGMPADATVWSLDAYAWLPNVVIAATSQGIYQSADFGASWLSTSDGIAPSAITFRVYVDPANPLQRYAATTEGVYRSTTGGLTWSQANAGLGAHTLVRAILLIGGGPLGSDLYVGTDDGVFASLDQGQTWRRVSNDGLGSHTIVWALDTVATLPGFVLAGIQGGGVAYRLLEPPVNTTRPFVIDQTPEVGTLEATTNGAWSGSQTITYELQWERCTGRDGSGEGTGCTAIADATDSGYVPVAADQGKYLRSKVTASNAFPAPSALTSRTSLATASPVGPAPGTLPGSTVMNNPTITNGFGTLQVGDTLNAAHNTWTPAPDSFGYAWYRCADNGGTCAPIAGATGQTYALVDADADHTLRVKVSGTSNLPPEVTSFTPLSLQTSIVLPRQVVKLSDPVVLGKPWVGTSLVASVGGWTSAETTTFTRTWEACDDAAGTACTPIAGVNGAAAWTILGIYAGKFVRVRVSADVNASFQIPAPAEATSAAIGPVVAAPPRVVATADPAITGLLVRTQTLTGSPGAWDGAPQLSLQWERCDAALAACSAIAGETGTTHVLGDADVGQRLRLVVSARNDWPETVTALSAPTGPVAASLKPALGAAAKVTGAAKPGRKLSVSPGTWTGVPAPTFRYQWLRDGKRIKGATKATYLVRKADRGHRISCLVTATSEAGTATTATKAVKIPKPKPKPRRG